MAVRTLFVLLLGASLAPASAQRASVAPQPVGGPAFMKYVEEGRSSPFGLDYVFALNKTFRDPALARDLGGYMGVRWVNFARINWGEIEPRPPARGRHTYRWQGLDEAVRQWQHQGVHIAMSLRFANAWANAKSTLKPTYLTGIFGWTRRLADYKAKPEHVGDLRAFVGALVERYDGDGDRDMPGLLFPILHYQVCNEAYNELFWGGTVEEYGEHLRQVARAARDACAGVKIILSGICLEPMDGFYDRHMDPLTRAYVERNLPRIPPNMRAFLRRMHEFSKSSLAFPDYDIVDARWSLYGVVEHCREEMRRAGRPNADIWSAEIYTAHPLLDAMVLPMTTLYPYPTPSRSLDYIKITRQPSHREYEAVNRWYRGMQAAMTVKTCMVGLNAGTRMLMNGWALDSQTPIAPYPLAVGGYKSTNTGKLWPAAHTYKLLIERLDGISGCRRLPVPDSAYVYECTLRGGKTAIVAFCDDHVARNHDEPGPTIGVSIPWQRPTARVSHIVTELGQTDPRIEIVETRNGRLSLRLTQYPVIVD